MTKVEKDATELSQLRDANQSLVLAAIQAQTKTASAEDTAAKMVFKAEHDCLTGLPNRSLLIDRLEQAMTMAKRQGHTVAIMFLDLDHFKSINDSFGHEAGDQLLLDVSRRLQECIRQSDTVSRQGGDEFIVLLPVVEALVDADLIARKLIETMNKPFFQGGHQHLVTLSIGISLYPRDGLDVDSLLRHADAAMYHAKAHGRNRYKVFTADLQEEPGREKQKKIWPRDGTARNQGESSASTQTQLQEANEQLVIATVEAQMLREMAEKATEQVSKLAKLEAHLQEIQKLDTLAVLAGGVAHDFNNLLTAIVGNASLGSIAVENHDDPSRHFDAIEKAATRAADLTRQLLAYAGKARSEMAEVDLDQVIQEIILLPNVSIPGHVTLDYDLGDRLPLVRGDASQIFQVLMNLVTNAGEANPPGVPGSITIRTRREQVTENAADSEESVLAMPPAPYVTLEVKDTGTGMAPEVMARAFEPFFTTKFTGRGLGLAAVIGIIRSHGGGIKVRSEPGQGTSFKIFLPAV